MLVKRAEMGSLKLSKLIVSHTSMAAGSAYPQLGRNKQMWYNTERAYQVKRDHASLTSCTRGPNPT